MMKTNIDTCPICGSLTEFAFKVPFRDGKPNLDGSNYNPDVEYNYCGVCKLYYSKTQRTWTDKDFLDQVYNARYAGYDSDITNANGNRPNAMYRLMHDEFQNYLKSNAYILDYGCGRGFWVDKLNKEGFKHIYGHDPYYRPDPEVLRDKYDLVTCTEVIEHDYDIVETFKKFSAMLYLGGALLVSTDVTDEMEKVSENYYTCPRVGHVMLYAKETLAYLANQAGFSLIHLSRMSSMQFHLFIKQR
jgi:2-polyprenyl-3-methyl-5-hydroxy-6-metoxy-1,4-benzoquinol methylase